MSNQYSQEHIKKMFNKQPLGKILKDKIEASTGEKFTDEAGLKKYLAANLANKNELKRHNFYRQVGWHYGKNTELKRSVEKRIKAGDPPKVSWKEKQTMHEEARRMRISDKLSAQKNGQANINRDDQIIKRRNIRASKDKTEAIERIMQNRDSAANNFSMNISAPDLASSMKNSRQAAKPIAEDSDAVVSAQKKPSVSIKNVDNKPSVI